MARLTAAIFFVVVLSLILPSARALFGKCPEPLRFLVLLSFFQVAGRCPQLPLWPSCSAGTPADTVCCGTTQKVAPSSVRAVAVGGVCVCVRRKELTDAPQL